MKRAFVFPGQGSQAVGMGKDLADAFPLAREVFEEVDDAIGQKLARLMFEGPESDLTLTENAQPALMAVSVATARLIESETGKKLAELATFVAGHSLGEYSALTAAGAFSLADSARLLKTRGQAMQQAVPVGEGAMAAILGLDFDKVREIAEEAAGADVCAAANDNADGQVVVSGDSEAVDRAVALAKDAGCKRAMTLTVSAPFHCALMQPAADVMRDALEMVEMRIPAPRLVANVTAAPVLDPTEIKQRLVEQVTATVRWREIMLFMAQDGVEQAVELGAGKVLSGLFRRTAKDIATANVSGPADLDAFLGAQ